MRSFRRRMKNLNTEIRRAERRNSGNNSGCGVIFVIGVATILSVIANSIVEVIR